MTKRVLSLILSMLLCFTLFACENNSSESVESGNETEESTTTSDTSEPSNSDDPSDPLDSDGSQPLLYKVTDANGKIAWLFGSIHIGRDDFYPLPDYVMNAYESSDALAVEFDIVEFEQDTSAMIDIVKSMLYTDGTTIKDYVPDEIYDTAVEILEENGLYNSVMDYYNLSMWSSFIDECIYAKLNLDMDSGIDLYLLNHAKENGKEIIDIESAEYQFGMMRNYSLELQVLLLQNSIASYYAYDEYSKELNSLMDIWSSGNEKEFYEYLDADWKELENMEDGAEKRLLEEYNNAMLTVRNGNMTEYVTDALESGDEVFVCVGAAHVLGSYGMVEQLRELGYSVELVK